MNVLFASAEVDPFAKVGGLADVVGSLPKALRKLGIDARVVMPAYRFIPRERYNIHHHFHFALPRPVGTTGVDIYLAEHDGVPVYFVRGWPYFGEEPSVYSTWNLDVPRFIFFCQAVVALCEQLQAREGWFPNVVHANDWHTGLLPFLIGSARQHSTLWARTGTVFSIHNMAYQGEHVGGWLWELGIPGRDHPELLSRGLTDNMLAMALAYSDLITTVSPRYATEIQYPYMGYGLDGLIRTRLKDLAGILNGIDTDLWNPETDPHLVAHYNADNFSERRVLNKRQLQAETGLDVRDDQPLIGLVSRLVWQKGIDLALPALHQLLSESDVQLVALGAGEREYNDLLAWLGSEFSHKARTIIGFNAAVAQRIYAGCDMFLMPSRYEPCGVGQMLAMRYGALPVVRETGGLADTVTNYDDGPADSGTGFTFQWEESDAVLNTLRWAVDVYRTRPKPWQRMQARAMRTDFSWTRSAKEYIALYQRAVERHRLF